MSVLVDGKQFSFHDSWLVKASYQGETLTLSAEYFNAEDVERLMHATISGIETIFRDDVPIPNFTMETSDAEIVELELVEEGVNLMLYWVDFQLKARSPRSYRFVGQTIKLEATPGSSAEDEC